MFFNASAPRATAAYTVSLPSVWSEYPTEILKKFLNSLIVKILASDKGVG